MSGEQPKPKPPTTQERTVAALERMSDLMARAEVARLKREQEARREALKRPERIGHQSEPRRFGFGVFARAIPGLAAVFSRKIPSEFWSLEGDTAIVSCPCGATPNTELGVPRECAGMLDKGGPCGRFYLYDGANVRVAFSPTSGTQEPQTPAAA